MAISPEMAAAVSASLDLLAAAVKPWTAERQYLNLGDHPRPAEEFFSTEDLDRLRAARAHYDPDGILLSNRPL
jgi:FAD/FMN-containing dehydrogenase